MSKGYYITYISENLEISNCLIPCKRITNIDQLNIVKKHISTRYCQGKNVVILNYKRIKYKGVINNDK